jgi:PTS system nitrogen regulatory IIA component
MIDSTAKGTATVGGDVMPAAFVDPVMTLEEIAGYFKVSEKTILRMVQAGELPAFKVSNQWRFLRAAIDQWLSSQMQRTSSENLAAVVQTDAGLPLLSKLLHPGRVLPDLQPGSKTTVLSALAGPLITEGIVENTAGYLEDLLAREAMLSTAIGNGIAVPHTRTPSASGLRRDAVVLGMCREGLDFAALDGQPTHLFFLIGSTSTETHLRLMARVMLLLRVPDMQNRLLAATNPDTICRLIERAEQEQVNE